MKKNTTSNKQILSTVGKNLADNCFGIKNSEKTLLVFDKGKIREATFFQESLKNVGKDCFLLKTKKGKFDGEEPSDKIARVLLNFPVALLVTSKSLSHTKARLQASKKGVRIASLPGIDLPMIERTLSGSFSQLAKLSEKLEEKLTQGKSIRVTTKSGTSLKFSISGRNGIADTGNLQKAGDFGNLPPGETFIAPVEKSINGKIVADGCISDFPLDKPVTLEIKNGVAVSITGGKTAEELKKAIKKIGRKAKVIAEFGIGTNQKAILSTEGENALEVEKVYGTVHFALGNNLDFGGVNEVPFHIDMILLAPTVEIDNKIILKNYKFYL